MEKSSVLTARSISKEFHDPVRIRVLNDISFDLTEGDFTSIIGKSGCGKSTLLYILSTMDTDYSGELSIDNVKLTGLSESELAAVRNEKIGFVFQFHYLLNEFTALKNVILPGYKLQKMSSEELEYEGIKHLRNLGIEHLAHKMAHRLSGGEKQRVAIARAMINNPLILMCDEPTGNLDNKNTEIVFEIFKELSETYKKALLIVTHDMNFAERTGRIIQMDDGRIIDPGKTHAPQS